MAQVVAKDVDGSATPVVPITIVTKLMFLLHVISKGCRILPEETLECDQCSYRAICDSGYFRRKEA